MHYWFLLQFSSLFSSLLFLFYFTEPSPLYDNNHYHEECLRCNSCGINLSGQNHKRARRFKNQILCDLHFADVALMESSDFMQQLRSFKPQSLGCAVARRKSSTTLIFPLPPQACSGNDHKSVGNYCTCSMFIIYSGEALKMPSHCVCVCSSEFMTSHAKAHRSIMPSLKKEKKKKCCAIRLAVRNITGLQIEKCLVLYLTVSRVSIFTTCAP